MVEFGKDPQNAQCTNCGQNVVTQTDAQSGLVTYGACCLIAFCGGVFGCCLIPFCVDGCKNIEHKCPNCNAIIGVRKPI